MLLLPPGPPPHTPHHPCGPALVCSWPLAKALLDSTVQLLLTRNGLVSLFCNIVMLLKSIFNNCILVHALMQPPSSDPRCEGMQTLLVQLLQQLQSSRITGDEALQRLLLHGCCKCLQCLGSIPDATDHSVSSRFIAAHDLVDMQLWQLYQHIVCSLSPLEIHAGIFLFQVIMLAVRPLTRFCL